MDSAKQEVSLSIVDENKQRDNDTYLGLLLFETADNDKYKTKGELPITMPKVGYTLALTHVFMFDLTRCDCFNVAFI